jgi:hypothetical protein
MESVKANENVGSSTAVLAKFDAIRDDVIQTTNLGDSGYMILRPDKSKP